MPTERQISEFPQLVDADVNGDNILHTKNRDSNADSLLTVQQIVDRVPTTDLSDLVPPTTLSVNTTTDSALIADASSSNEIRRVAFSTYISALGIPVVSGSITNGNFEISGLQLRWGTFISNTDAPQIVNFSLAFSNQCFGVWLNFQGANASNPRYAQSFTTTTFTLDRNDNINQDDTINYFAIGR